MSSSSGNYRVERPPRPAGSESSAGQGSHWNGYEWNVPIDELVDCNKCPSWCRRCYGYGKARPIWQKALLVCIYIAIIDVGLAFLFRFSVFSDIEFYVGVKDQRMINRGDHRYNLSPILCSEYRLQVPLIARTDGASFNAYLLSDGPFLKSAQSEYLSMDANVSLPANEVHIAYHYLGSSATVTLAACAPDRMIRVYAVRDPSSIVDWEAYKCCGRYSDEFLFRECNRDGSAQDARRYAADFGFSGDLFLVLMSDPYSKIPFLNPDPVNVTMSLERYDYQWSNNSIVGSCEVSDDCTVNLEKGSNAIVVELPVVAERYTQLKATCVASVWRYFQYFAMLPLGIALSLLLIGAVLYGCQQQVNRLAEEGDRRRAMACGSTSPSRSRRRNRWGSSSMRSPLVRNEVNQVQEGGDLPPSYNSLAVATISDSIETEEPPPSYSSVAGNSDVL